VINTLEVCAKLAYEQGLVAKSIFDNPYWVNWPKPSKLGEADEIAARKWVDGWFSKVRADDNSSG
jgi:hypothetical protein